MQRRRVSIQRLFGFVIIYVNFRETLNLRFQYNDCLGSSMGNTAIPIILKPFQYNDCLGSSTPNNSEFPSGVGFQYNDCLGSSWEIAKTIDEYHMFQYNDCLGSSGYRKDYTYTVEEVSIQRLFGFVHSSQICCKPPSFVSIQRLFGFVSSKLPNKTVIFGSFNTTIVWVRL